MTHQTFGLAVDVAEFNAGFSNGRSVDKRCDLHHVRQQNGVEPIRLRLRRTESKERVKSAHILVKLLERGKKDVFFQVLVLGAELEEASLVVDVVLDVSRSKAMGRMGRIYGYDM